MQHSDATTQTSLEPVWVRTGYLGGPVQATDYSFDPNYSAVPKEIMTGALLKRIWNEDGDWPITNLIRQPTYGKTNELLPSP